jgi:hypothetical protein
LYDKLQEINIIQVGVLLLFIKQPTVSHNVISLQNSSCSFKIGGQIIHAVKYAQEVVLLAKEEKMLQDMNDKLIEIERCYGKYTRV